MPSRGLLCVAVLLAVVLGASAWTEPRRALKDTSVSAPYATVTTDKNGNTNVQAPGTNVNAGQGGANVQAPGTNVNAGQQGGAKGNNGQGGNGNNGQGGNGNNGQGGNTNVQAPGTNVNAGQSGTNVQAPYTAVSTTPGGGTHVQVPIGGVDVTTP